MNEAKQKIRNFPEKKEKYKTNLSKLFYQELIRKGITFEEFIKKYEFSPSSVLDRLEYKVVGYRRGKTQEITNKLINIMRRETPLSYEFYSYFQLTDGREPEIINIQGIQKKKEIDKKIEEIKDLLDRLSPDDILALDLTIIKKNVKYRTDEAKGRVKNLLRRISINRKTELLHIFNYQGVEEARKYLEENVKEFTGIKIKDEALEEAIREVEPELEKDIKEYWRTHF